MSTRELVELAQLDAMGLLDEQEAREFEVAFAAAPAEIQEQIRKEQSRLCVLEPVLPDIQPPEHLRGKVLAAVHESIVESIIAKAPQTAEAEIPAPAYAPTARHAAGREIPGMEDGSRRRGSRLWRSTAIAFAAAAVVLGITTLQLQSKYESALALKRSGDTVARMNELFGENAQGFLFGTDTTRLLMEPVAGLPGEEWQKVRAAVWQNPSWDDSRLVCENLPSSGGEKYALVVITEEGTTVAIADRLDPVQAGLVGFRVPKQLPANAMKLALQVTQMVDGMPVTAIILETKALLG